MNKYVVKANLFFYFMTTSYYIKSRNNMIYVIYKANFFTLVPASL